MQTQLIAMIVTHVLLLGSVQTEQAVDIACQRYAGQIAAFVPCDTREFVTQPEPPNDIGHEAALIDRVEDSRPSEEGVAVRFEQPPLIAEG